MQFRLDLERDLPNASQFLFLKIGSVLVGFVYRCFSSATWLFKIDLYLYYPSIHPTKGHWICIGIIMPWQVTLLTATCASRFCNLPFFYVFAPTPSGPCFWQFLLYYPLKFQPFHLSSSLYYSKRRGGFGQGLVLCSCAGVPSGVWQLVKPTTTTRVANGKVGIILDLDLFRNSSFGFGLEFGSDSEPILFLPNPVLIWAGSGSEIGSN